MSTIKVNTIQTTGGVEVYTAKAWVNFNGTGTVAIRASGNVSSITDNGVGNYTVNLTTALSDTNYSVVNTVRPDTDRLACAGERFSVTRTTSAYGVSTGDATSYYDASYVSSAIFR